MSFAEPRFLLFLGIFFVCYFITPKKIRYITLLISSYVFYWFVGSWFALCVVTFTIVTVHISAVYVERLREKEAAKSIRRIPLTACLILNFGLLLLFRYSGAILPKLGLLLIPGISFYTFQAAGYLVDVYKGKAKAERNILKTALFLSFFPQLIQGPISRHSQIASDLFAGHGWSFERARLGILRIMWGYFLKIVIADYAVIMVNTVFGNYDAYGGAVIALSVVIYSVQIYADFAGGINIALGIGHFLGIKNMPENFSQPFFARTLTDFWRRWHITLGLWLKDYLFYPLAITKLFGKIGKASRKWFGADTGKLIPASIATFIVYFAMSLWHGITAATLVFGALNGGIITVSLFFEKNIEKLRRKTGIDSKKNKPSAIFAVIRTFVIMTALRYFARADSLASAVAMLNKTVTAFFVNQLWDGTLLSLGLTAPELILLAVSMIIMFAREFAAEVCAKNGVTVEAKLIKASPAFQFAAILVVLLLITYCGIYRDGYTPSAFIYAQY